jgi:hypothetical protein
MPNLIGAVLGYEVEKEIGWYRQNLHILILGAYIPENAKKRLEILRTCLIERGYSNTYLVADHPDDNTSDEDWNIYWERKSNELMRDSDLNLFVFFADCSNEGVTDELAYFCSKIQKFSGCYVILKMVMRVSRPRVSKQRLSGALYLILRSKMVMMLNFVMLHTLLLNWNVRHSRNL